jgi:hypothetical protein
MENKQTAIEWFYQRILAKDIKSVFEQALAMEKEQIMDAHEKAYIDMNLSFRSADRAEEYYNETYKK